MLQPDPNGPMPGMSASPITPAETALTQQWLVVRLAEEYFALPLPNVEGIETSAPITPVPGSAPAILGIYSHHGTLIAAVDLAEVLGISRSTDRNTTRFFVRVRAGGLAASLEVDEAVDVVSGEQAFIEPLPEEAQASSRMFVARLHTAGTKAVMLDAGQVLKTAAAGRR